MKIAYKFCLAVLIFCFAACAQASQIANFQKAGEGLYRGAAPGDEGVKYLKEIGVKVIVDLRQGKASVRREERLANKFGIKYINIPLSPFNSRPDSEEIKKFLKIAADPENMPVFVHCHNGIHRTGRMIDAYHENRS